MSNKKTWYKLIIAGVVLLVVIGITIAGIHGSKINRVSKERQQRDSLLTAGPVVNVFKAAYAGGGKDIMLVGEARPYQTATIYAKISGYLQSINVDKGDHVTINQVLAYVDNPEIDQQYNAAVADLENKRKILERDKKLLDQKYISQEDYDLSATNVQTAQANVKSLSDQQQYKTLRAPFSGTVTDRYADPGALIQNAINSQTSAQPVVSIATLEKLRVYVYVEQKDAGFLRDGYPVDITTTDNGDIHIQAKITRYAGQLDPKTRMMLVEIDIDNRDHAIVPGSYVNVHIKGPQSKTAKIQIPGNALVVHKDKTMVALIDKDTALHFEPVTVGENNGDSVTILKGLQAGQLIAVQVGESLQEGQKVRILNAAQVTGQPADTTAAPAAGTGKKQDKKKI